MKSAPCAISPVVVVLLSAGGISSDAQAADYPTKPVRIIVPTAAGASLDTMTRALAQRLSERAGKQLVIDNRAGAGGAIGMELGARAAADGYSIVMFTLTHLATSTIPGRRSVDFVKDHLSSTCFEMPRRACARSSILTRSIGLPRRIKPG